MVFAGAIVVCALAEQKSDKLYHGVVEPLPGFEVPGCLFSHVIPFSKAAAGGNAGFMDRSALPK